MRLWIWCRCGSDVHGCLSLSEHLAAQGSCRLHQQNFTNVVATQKWWYKFSDTAWLLFFFTTGKICDHLYCNRHWFCNTQSTSYPRVTSPPRTQFNNICGCNAPLYILWCVKWLYNTTHTQTSLCHGSRWVLFTACTQSVTLKRRFTKETTGEVGICTIWEKRLNSKQQ